MTQLRSRITLFTVYEDQSVMVWSDARSEIFSLISRQDRNKSMMLAGKMNVDTIQQVGSYWKQN